jgi:anti-sigma B factor antagonist
VAGPEPATEPLLRVERADRDGVACIELVGELDLSTLDPLKLRLELLERETLDTIVVDLRRVTLMDSIGLGVLASHRLRARRAGRSFVLVQGPPHVQELFELTGMRDRFEWVEAD